MKTLRLAAAILLLSAAVAVWAWNLADSQESEESKYRTEWMCADCKSRFSLSGSKVDRAAAEAGGVPLLCSQCRQRKVWQVVACSRCGGLHFGAEVPGMTGLCPTCHPDARPVQTVFDHGVPASPEGESTATGSQPRGQIPANRN